ncbi:MAG TPA: 16S rRNA (cytosine(1402)-N(4))-methyltransferase RsmH [Polyangiaceae bacterium]|nr:16S rRNA (cytosine(1402)-N(4))-methyltransferase RsmH [Polyangiaceae bacterium]
MDPTKPVHRTVMRDEVVQALAPVGGGLCIDVTAGYGGHSEAVLRTYPNMSVIAFDRDPEAVRNCRARLAPFGERAQVVHAEFSQLKPWLLRNGIGQIDALIADLGVSSPQLDEGHRGLSFRFEGPLDMRMDPSRGETALELIQRLGQDELADLIFQLGEERSSRRIAACIKQALAAGELQTTLDLRRAVIRAVGPQRNGGIDPATRTFQALRIGVNRELEEITSLLGQLHEILRPGAVAAVISFHSLEDRLVKRCFQERALWRRLSAKPLIPSSPEQDENPRSRSAKLRVVARTGLMQVPTPVPGWVDPWESRNNN